MDTYSLLQIMMGKADNTMIRECTIWMVEHHELHPEWLNDTISVKRDFCVEHACRIIAQRINQGVHL